MAKHTVADLKRRIQVGTRLRCLQNTYVPTLTGTERTVTQIQSNGYWFHREGAGATPRAWMDFPKASQVTWLDADTFRIQLDSARPERYVELQFLPAEAP